MKLAVVAAPELIVTANGTAGETRKAIGSVTAGSTWKPSE